jgi:hypothetical protein
MRSVLIVIYRSTVVPTARRTRGSRDAHARTTTRPSNRRQLPRVPIARQKKDCRPNRTHAQPHVQQTGHGAIRSGAPLASAGGALSTPGCTQAIRWNPKSVAALRQHRALLKGDGPHRVFLDERLLRLIHHRPIHLGRLLSTKEESDQPQRKLDCS